MSGKTAPAEEPPSSGGAAGGFRFQAHWLGVLCLLGVDYFSTLAYQPSLAFQSAGRLAPLGTAVVVLVTLTAALPVYWFIAGRSTQGQGSIALLEGVVRGWRGKTLILLLLGFAATDFVMLKSISLADAAEHLLHNNYVAAHRPFDSAAERARALCLECVGPSAAGYCTRQVMVTLLLGLVGFGFWFLLRRGFSRNIFRIAVPLVAVYLALNALVILCGVHYLVQNPGRVTDWLAQLRAGEWHPHPTAATPSSWLFLAVLSLLLLPALSLGLSGFELSLLLMPQVKGDPRDDPERPRGRIRNTRKMLVAAALVMAVLLPGATLVTALLVPEAALRAGGAADNRALAYLAHGGQVSPGPGEPTLDPMLGPAFGTAYDVTTILVLILTGTTVMTSLARLLPQFLLRFGMEFRWVHRWGLLMALFAVLNVGLTLYFRASVHHQRGAYATSVLVLMTSAAMVAWLAHRASPAPAARRRSWRWGVVTALFALTTLALMAVSPTGVLIAFGFIAVLLGSSVVSRALRSDEFRTTGLEFASQGSRFLWDSLRMAEVPVIVPHRPGRHERREKERTIRDDHNLTADVDIVFLEVEVDDPSNFYQRLRIDVCRDEHQIVVKVTQCTSVAHAIATIALEVSKVSARPPAVHLGWSEMNLLAASWSYLAFGEGNIAWKVHELIQAAEPDPERRPRVVVG